MDIFNAKRGLVVPTQTAFMNWGHLLEPAIADAYARDYGVTLQRCNRTLRHPKYSWVLATPDRFVIEERRRRRVCEIKTTGSLDDKWGEEGSADVPLDYLAQVQWQLEVVNLDEADLVVGILDRREIRRYRITRNQRLIDLMLDEVAEFWHEHVLTGVPPELDGGDGTKAWLNHAYPKSGEKLVEAPFAAAAWAVKYMDSKAEEADAKEAKDEAAAYLKAMIGPDAGIKGPWGTATWKTTKSDGIDWERAARDLAAQLRGAYLSLRDRSSPDDKASVEAMLAAASDEEIVKRYTAPGVRRFKLTPNKEGD
jgi:putative phage-type endonuclease